jgi:hypothetical protein
MRAINTESNMSPVRELTNAELHELTASELDCVSGASVAGDVVSAATMLLHLAKGFCEGMAEGLIGFVTKPKPT